MAEKKSFFVLLLDTAGSILEGLAGHCWLSFLLDPAPTGICRCVHERNLLPYPLTNTHRGTVSSPPPSPAHTQCANDTQNDTFFPVSYVVYTVKYSNVFAILLLIQFAVKIIPAREVTN